MPDMASSLTHTPSVLIHLVRSESLSPAHTQPVEGDYPGREYQEVTLEPGYRCPFLDSRDSEDLVELFFIAEALVHSP